jgi:HK97 family phage major capsid protein
MNNAERVAREKRANVWDGMTAIMEGAKRADGSYRSLSADEAREYDRLEADLDGLDPELAMAQRSNVPSPYEFSGPVRKDSARREVRGARNELLGADQSATDWLHAARANGVQGLRNDGTDRDMERYWQERFGFRPASVETRTVNGLAEGITSGSGAGSAVVPAEWATSFVDLLRPQLVLSDASIMMMTGAQETLPVYTADVAPVGMNENTSASLDANPSFSPLLFSTLGYAYTDITLVSRQIVEDTNQAGGLNALMQSVISQKYKRLVEQVAFYGDASAPQSPGLVGETGLQSFQCEGSLADFDDISTAVYNVRTRNAEPSAIITSPLVVELYDKLKASTYATYWRPNPDVAHLWPPRVSTTIVATETVTSGAVSSETGGSTSSAFVGDFRRCVIGVRADLEVDILRERYADMNALGIRSYMRFVPRWTHPESFCRIFGY